jgi:anti-sigma factor RsiW
VRGNLSEQDLTDYALNELPPHERLYVESMLAASEECRHDIVKTIELAQLLEEGFEREMKFALREDVALRPEQREFLVQPHHTWRYAFRDIAAAIGLAACVAFGIVTFDDAELSGARLAADKVVEASAKAADSITAAVQSPEDIDLAKALASLRELAEESSKLIPASNDKLIEAPTICTPPTLIMESAQLTGIGDLAP